MLLGEQYVGERCGGLRVVRREGEEAAVSVLGGGKVGGGFGDLGGEQDVFGLLGCELEGGDEFGRRGGRVGGSGELVESGQCAEGAGSQGGILGGEYGCSRELGARLDRK